MTAAEQRPALPEGLRDRVLTASLRARAAGRPEPVVPEISPAEAFSRAAYAFYRMLGVLLAEDWHRPALRDLNVQGLVGHLVGVEEDVHRGLAGGHTDNANVGKCCTGCRDDGCDGRVGDAWSP